MADISAISLVFASSILNAVGTMFFKRSANKFSFSPAGIIRNSDLIKGLTIYVVAISAYIIGLSLEKLSILYPIAATQYIWVSILAVKYLKEEMNLWKWSGIGLVILGVAIISIGG